MKFSVYQVSRKGGREKNEDRMGYCYTRESGLFALADGMGGHPEGEVASQLALQTLAAIYQRDARPTVKDPLRYLTDGIMAGHHQLQRYATEKALLDTPRTTCVACIVQHSAVYWAHCGDSRLYLVRGGELLARTRDHSYSALSEAQHGKAPRPEQVNRNVLFTCLGSPGRPVIDTFGPMLLKRGDRVLLCSDGLWGVLPDEVITRELSTRGLADAVQELVEQALRTAGPRSDNVSVIALEWEEEEEFEETRSVSTRGLGSDVFASTIQPGRQGGEDDELDEDEIERRIREINDAIKRTAERGGSKES